MKTNRLFCLIELAAVAALYFFENNSGTRAALAVSALVPLLSVLCAYRCSRKAALSLDVPRHGEKGASLVCRLCAPPLLLCEGRAELRLQNAFTREEARAAAVVGEAVSLSVPHCGLLTVTAENAEIRDLFGLCRFPVSSGAPQTVPVCARTVAFPPFGAAVISPRRRPSVPIIRATLFARSTGSCRPKWERRCCTRRARR